MNKRVLFTILIFFIVFTSLGAVSAVVSDEGTSWSSDVVGDDFAVVSNISESVDENEIISVDDTNGNYKTFTELMESIQNTGENEIIELEYDYKFNNDTDSQLNSEIVGNNLLLNKGITISKNVTIDGKNHYIDGNNLSRIFNIAHQGSLTLKNLNIINAHIYGYYTNGGAIYNNGTLIIENCSFFNCTTGVHPKFNIDYGFGGAIYNEKNLTVSLSNFTDNSAGRGGSIYNNGSSNLSFCKFRDGFASEGQEIYSDGPMSLINSSIYNYQGQAVVVGHVYLTIQNSLIECHDGIKSGGKLIINNTLFKYCPFSGIYHSGEAIITNSNFTNVHGINCYYNNTAIQNCIFGNSSAGCIKSNATVKNCIFDNSSLFNSGNLTVISTIFRNYQSGLSNSGNLTVSFCDFNGINNSCINNSEGNFNITNSNFINNILDGRGAAIYNKINSGSVSYCNFTNNSARFGGAICGVRNITNCLFIDNYAIAYGGAIDGGYNITNCVFVNNSAGYGGAIANDLPRDSHVENCDFINNSAQYGSAVCQIYNSTKSNLTNNNFSGNVGNKSNVIIYNKGILYLNNNKINSEKAEICNLGRIRSSTHIIILNNSTITISPNVNGEIFAVIYDDQNNLISGNLFFNISYWELQANYDNEKNCFIANYSSDVLGPHLINVSSNGFLRPEIQSGVVNVKSNSYFSYGDSNINAYPNYGYFTFTLKDGEGNTLANKSVSYTFNGKQISTTTNANGQITLVISVKNAASYIFTCNFEGDMQYKSSTFTKTIKVAKNSVKFFSPTKKVKKSKTKKTFKITLKTSNKKALTKKYVYIKINKKTYKAKTNTKGVATFKLKLPKTKKTYKYKVTFKGDSGNYKKTYSNRLKVY